MSSSRIVSLDGLRALSIFLVLFDHFSYSNGFPIRHNGITDDYAHYGVRIFFVISGFLITTLLLRERDQNGTINLTQFYIRRAFRILPISYVYLIMLAILFHKSLTPKQLTIAFTYLSSYDVHLPWVLSHLWSLSVEEQFYLVWPLVMALGVVVSRRFAFVAMVIAPLFRFVMKRTSLPLAAVYFFPAVIDSLAAGCLLALYQPEALRHRSFFAWRGFPLIWAFTLSIPALKLYSDAFLFWPLPQIIHNSALTVFNFGIVLCIQNAITVRPRILNHPIVVWIGMLSYSLYLWQMPFTNPNAHSWATTFPQNLIVTFLAAVISLYAIEKPFLRMRERRKENALQIHNYPLVEAD
jgi:peptidoglycan/LPS O-acetylase OafA/YrhL